MSYSALIGKTWDQAILSSVLLELTYRCNLDCFLCYNDRNLQGIPLRKDDYFRLLADLAHLQVLNLTLSGGEALAHPDFWAIGRQARTLGFVIRIKTNGHALGPILASRLKTEVDPFGVELSLHGATAATHDRQTRIAGSFKRLMENIGTMQQLGLRLKLNCPLTAWNEHEVELIFALAERLGLPLFMDTRITPRDDGDATPLSIQASIAGMRKAIAMQKARSAAARFSARTGRPAATPPTRRHCGAGASTLTIDPVGNIYPCVQWRQPVGNLHQACVSEVWQNSAALSKIRDTTEQVKTLLDVPGTGTTELGFCPGLAEQRTGSPVKLDPDMLKRINILQDLSG